MYRALLLSVLAKSEHFVAYLAEVWRSAEQRRVENIGRWLGNAFERRGDPKLPMQTWLRPRKLALN